MYIVYIDQILRNLDGMKGSTIQPAAAFVAATLWTLYGARRAKWDLPLVWANVPGIILAAAARHSIMISSRWQQSHGRSYVACCGIRPDE